MKQRRGGLSVTSWELLVNKNASEQNLSIQQYAIFDRRLDNRGQWAFFRSVAKRRIILFGGGVGLLLGLAMWFCAIPGEATAESKDEAVRQKSREALEHLGVQVREGAIVRGAVAKKQLALVFTGHEFAESATVILDELQKHQAKASFFLTGDFLTNTAFSKVIRGMIDEGHYIGPHSDKHLLYCSWEQPKQTLLTKADFSFDLLENRRKLETFGIKAKDIRYFLPPYEHYNQEIADWTCQLGMVLVNFTPGTRSNADYTGEKDANFVSTQQIYESIVARERQDPNGLNGFLLLLHLGSGPGRVDKFHTRFGELLDYFAERKYELVSVEGLLGSGH